MPDQNHQSKKKVSNCRKLMPGTILESKVMCAIFLEKGKKMLKKGKKGQNI